MPMAIENIIKSPPLIVFTMLLLDKNFHVISKTLGNRKSAISYYRGWFSSNTVKPLINEHNDITTYYLILNKLNINEHNDINTYL